MAKKKRKKKRSYTWKGPEIPRMPGGWGENRWLRDYLEWLPKGAPVGEDLRSVPPNPYGAGGTDDQIAMMFQLMFNQLPDNDAIRRMYRAGPSGAKKKRKRK